MNSRMQYILLLLSLLSFQCKKESSSEPQNAPNVNPISSITGVVDNWSYGSDKKIVLVPGGSESLCGSSSVDSTGKFQINSLTKPADSVLVIDTMGLPPTVQINNRNARLSFGSLYIMSNDLKKNLGFVVQFSNEDLSKMSSGDYYVEYLYSTEPVNISGYEKSTIRSNYSGDSIGYFQNNFNISLKQGWNKVIFMTTAIKDSTMRVQTISDVDPQKAKFIYSYTGGQTDKKRMFLNNTQGVYGISKSK